MRFQEVCTDLLSLGYSVRFRATGTSMQPTISDGEMITVSPFAKCEPSIGDILLYQNSRGLVAHRFSSRAESKAPFVLRGDAPSSSPEAVSVTQILGKVVSIEPGFPSLDKEGIKGWLRFNPLLPSPLSKGQETKKRRNFASTLGRSTTMLKKWLLIFFILLMTALHLQAADRVPVHPTQLQQVMRTVPLYFIENQGQLPKDVEFYLRGRQHAAYFTRTGVYFSKVPANKLIALVPQNQNPQVEIIAEDPQSGKINYFIGNDPDKWRTNIATYRTVTYKQIYPGIDMKFHGTSELQYDSIVYPGADPSQIQIALKGIDGWEITEKGDLSITMASATLIQEKPYAYQEINGNKIEIQGRFKILNATPDEFLYGFEVGPYDKRFPLIIDPAIEYSSMIGGSNNDRAYAMTTDQQGRLFVSGDTRSSNFDTTAGVFDTTFDSGRDGWVAKFDTNLSGSGSLIYATYFGGNNSDAGNGISVDSSGNVYVTGTTASTDFPVISGSFDTTYNGGDEAFAFKLNSTGSALIYSTFLGGSQNDEGHQIAIDSSNNAYITGLTNSTDYPTTAGAFDTSTNGNTDIFVTKLNSTGTSPLTYSTYIGGSNADNAIGIAVDSSGLAYITGSSASTNFPTTANAYDTTNNGGNDAVIIKINAAGSSLLYSTYFGGTGHDFGGGNPIDIGSDSAGAANGISVNSSGVLCIAGQTSSNDFTTTAGAYDNTLNSNNQEDAFVLEIDPGQSGLSSLLYSTYLGGNNKEAGFDAVWTNFGTCCIIGYTQSDNFPVKIPLYLNNPSPPPTLKYDGTFKLAQRDGFIVSFNFDQDDPLGTADPNDPDDLVFSSFIGGDQQDSAFAGAAAGQGTVCCLAGVTFKDPTQPFPTTSGTEPPVGHTKAGFQQVNDGNDDGFVCCIRGAATAVELISFNATSYGKKILVEWQTGYESNNLGFHIYRNENGQRKLLTESILAGSALTVKGESPLAGFSYAFWDDVPKKGGRIEYWLEDVDLDGTRTLHGPVFPTNAQGPPPQSIHAVSLSKIGHGKPRFDSGVFETQAAIIDSSAAFSAAETSAVTVAAATSTSTQWDIAAGPAVKISVRQKGWYRVTQPELVAEGINPLADARNLQLYVGGVQVPMIVQGEKDARLDPADFIEFYGSGIDTAFSDTQVYWLIQGSAKGKRISVTKPANQSPTTAASFPFTVERKDRTIYFGALLNGDAENFFGAIITSTPLQQSLTLQKVHVAPAGNVLLEVSVQGVTDLPEQSPDHRLQVLINGNYVGELIYDGRSLRTQSFSISQAWLQEGQNNVTLTELQQPSDVSLVNFIRITYWHTFNADSNVLPFTVAGKKQVTIQGFSNSLIRVADVTNAGSPQELIGTIKQQGTGFGITVNIPSSGQRTLLAFAGDRILTAALKTNQPSNWHRANLDGEVTMIVHSDFADSLANLEAFRASQGRSVAFVDIEDVYDEFNFGVESPFAVKDFLNRARTSWRKRPAFVLLAGDASADPRNYLGLGDFDYVPTKLLDTSQLETASDNWFVDFNGDEIPEMAIGRLPVRTAAEADLIVSKITNYEQGPAAGWRSEVILAADDNELFDFEGATNQVESLLPEGTAVTKIMLGQTDIGAARNTLLTGINSGKLLVNYFGHGSVQIWAKERLLQLSDTSTFSNADRLPFFNIMTCLNGFFHDLNLDSLAEGLLKAENGGAVGVWASSGFTATEVQAVLGRTLFESLFGGQSLTIGEATVKAKQSITNRDVLRSWVLFGDPVTKLQ